MKLFADFAWWLRAVLGGPYPDRSREYFHGPRAGLVRRVRLGPFGCWAKKWAPSVVRASIRRLSSIPHLYCVKKTHWTKKTIILRLEHQKLEMHKNVVVWMARRKNR